LRVRGKIEQRESHRSSRSSAADRDDDYSAGPSGYAAVGTSVLVSRYYGDVNLETDEFGCQVREALIVPL
jgi:hypothetical protein